MADADNREAAETLADLVELLGHDAEVAFDGPSALELATRTKPDLVVCDIGLPAMTGYDVARALRDAGLRTTKLVALTGYARPEDCRGPQRRASTSTSPSPRTSRNSSGCCGGEDATS